MEIPLLSSAFTLLALAATAPAATVTIPATGWTHDIVINNGQGGYNTTVTGTMDGGPGSTEGYTFGEAGTYPVEAANTPTAVNGLRSGAYTSQTGSGAQFTFQSFASNNALLLKDFSTYTLDLVTPDRFSSLSIFGTSAGGSAAAIFALLFSDGTSSSVYTVLPGVGVGRDWLQPDKSTALSVGGRLSNRSEDDYTNLNYQQNPAISIYESTFTLGQEDRIKPVSSITFIHTGGGTLAVMALSGQSVPEPTAAVLVGTVGLAFMRRRR